MLYYIGEDNMDADKQLVYRVIELAYEVLNDVILPMCGIKEVFADPYLASIDCYTCSVTSATQSINDEVLEQEIVDAIIKKYNLNEYAPISGYTPLALIALIIIDKGGQYEEF